MVLAALVLVLAFVVRLVALPALETTLTVLLSMPLLYQTGAWLVPGWGEGDYWPLVITVTVLVVGVRWRELSFDKDALRSRFDLQSIAPIIVLCAAFAVFHRMNLLWADFINLGERLRDYALLDAIIKSPIELNEPWMDGASLNYYSFWYRVGHMFHALLGWETWEVYHALGAFTLAAYCACCFRLLLRYTRTSMLVSGAIALLVTLGSNVAGLVFGLGRGTNWWGPSRVIPGAINEFPAWSFVLGDLHPHFLNLPLIPLLGLLLLEWARHKRTPLHLVTGAVCLVAVPTMLIYSANPWEAPVWIALGGVFLTLLWWTRPVEGRETAAVASIPLECLLLAGALLVIHPLQIAAQHVAPGDYPIQIVGFKVPGSRIADLGQHFGLPLVIVVCAAVARLGERPLRWVAAAPLVCAFLFPNALPWLLVAFAMNLARAWNDFQALSGDERSRLGRVFLESCGIVGLGMIIGCELVFLDDPYGGENERMNTIFKFYSSAWFLVHAHAYWLVSEQVASARIPKKALAFTAPLLGAVWLAFFARAAALRIKDLNAPNPSDPRGLGAINRQYPGARLAIEKLSALPRARVLEAQGNAYATTSHVSTLAGQPSFLGWKNHVDLLVRDYEESARREKVTDEIYKQTSCEKLKEILQREKIGYFVWGPLEKARYKSKQPPTECLTPEIESGEYKIYTP